MKVKMPSAHRAKYVFGALLLAATTVLPSLFPANVSAAGQLTNRSIKMSSSAASAASVSYEFTLTTTEAMQSLVVDFCSNNPIIGSSCTTTNMANATGVTMTSGDSTLNGWATTGSTTARIKVAGTSVAAGTYTFTISGITNPTSTGTFFARIYTYANATFGSPSAYTSPTVLGDYRDYGGVALSTTSQISVTGTVQESLTFCVSGLVLSSPPTSCGATSLPTLPLGQGSPAVLDSGTTSTGSVYTIISTNAVAGAAIRMKVDNNCGGLKRAGASGCDIAAIGATTGSTTNAMSSTPAGTGLIGMKASSTATTGTLTSAAPYNTANYGLNADSTGFANDNVTATYGNTVASSTGILDTAITTLTFAARPAATTPAGVYAANYSMIAVGTY